MEEFLEVLQKIIQKGTTDLTENDKAFLRARWMYLTPEQKGIFASVVGIQGIPVVTEPVTPVIPQVLVEVMEEKAKQEIPVVTEPVTQTPEAIPQTPVVNDPIVDVPSSQPDPVNTEVKDPYDPDA